MIYLKDHKIKYFASCEGKEAIKIALQRAYETISRLNEARKLDSKILYEPMTI